MVGVNIVRINSDKFILNNNENYIEMVYIEIVRANLDKFTLNS